MWAQRGIVQFIDRNLMWTALDVNANLDFIVLMDFVQFAPMAIIMMPWLNGVSELTLVGLIKF